MAEHQVPWLNNLHDNSDSENRVLDLALAYIKINWPIFPVHSIKGGKCACGKSDCINPGKHPATDHGLHDASTDEAQIRKWFGRRKYNIAIATGSVSGVFVVDVDIRDDKDGRDIIDLLQERYNKLPDTVETITGSKSTHLYFLMPDDGRDVKNSTNKLGHISAKGIDVRGSGGYVVAPPSLHVSGNRYEWEGSSDPTEGVRPAEAPPWLLDLVCSKHSAGDNSVIANFEQAAYVLTDYQILEIKAALDWIDYDDRQTWINQGMSFHSTQAGQQAFELWDEWSRQSAKYDHDDQIRNWKSFRFNRQIRTLDSLFWDARQAGFPGLPDSWGENDTPKLEDIAPFACQDVQVHPRIEMPEYRPVVRYDRAEIIMPPGIMKTITEWITDTAPRPQPIFGIGTSIVLIGTILGRLYETPTALRTNFYVMSLGQTAAGKEHPRTCLNEVLLQSELKDMIGGDEIASAAALNSMLYRSPVQVSQNDEFGMWLRQSQAAGPASLQHGLLRRLMTIFTSASKFVPGQELSTNHLKNPSDMTRRDIYCPNLSLHFTTTLSELTPGLSSASVYSGFLNRILLMHTTMGRPRLRDELPQLAVPSQIFDWISRVRDMSRLPGNNLLGTSAAPESAFRIHPDERAKSIIREYLNYTEELQDELLESGMDSLWARAMEHVWKLSLVASLSDDPDLLVIKESHVDWAIRFVQHSISAMQQLADDHIADSPFASVVKQVRLAVIESGKGLTRNEIMRKVPAYRGMKPREQSEVISAIDMLEDIRRISGSGPRDFVLLKKS